MESLRPSRWGMGIRKKKKINIWSQPPRQVLKEKILRHLSPAPWERKIAKFSWFPGGRRHLGVEGRKKKIPQAQALQTTGGWEEGICFSVACKKTLEPLGC